MALTFFWIFTIAFIPQCQIFYCDKHAFTKRDCRPTLFFLVRVFPARRMVYPQGAEPEPLLVLP